MVQLAFKIVIAYVASLIGAFAFIASVPSTRRALCLKSSSLDSTVEDRIVIKRSDPKKWFDDLEKQAVVPDMFRDLARTGSKILSEADLPHRKQEPYRYANLEALFQHSYDGSSALPVDIDFASTYFSESSVGQRLVFVNGKFDKSLSDTSKLPKDVFLGSFLGESLSDSQQNTIFSVLDHIPEIGADKNTCQGTLPFAALNQACLSDVAAVIIPEGVNVVNPIQVIFLACAPNENEMDGTHGSVCHPRMAVIAGKNSQCTLMQTFAGSGDYFSNCLTRILVGDGAHIVHYHTQEQGPKAHHLDTVLAELGEESKYAVNLVASGGLHSRTNLQVEFMEERGHCDINGVSLCSDRQLIDMHTQLGHASPNTTCKQNQRNIVADRSECVFKGRIRVDGIAQKTAANQLCRTLMLSDKARVTVMPSLEITADDVICTHGATVADLDEECLFYLNCRGISSAEARALIIKGFSFDLINSIPDSNFKIRMLKKLLDMTPQVSRAVSAEGAYSSI